MITVTWIKNTYDIPMAEKRIGPFELMGRFFRALAICAISINPRKAQLEFLIK